MTTNVIKVFLCLNFLSLLGYNNTERKSFMDYKKIIKDNYTLHLIKTDRFKTINIGLKLTKEYNKEEFAYLNLLARVLPINGTKNYKTVNDITKKLESLYNTGIYFKSLQTSKNMSFEASLRIVNPKYTEISMYKELSLIHI